MSSFIFAFLSLLIKKLWPVILIVLLLIGITFYVALIRREKQRIEEIKEDIHALADSVLEVTSEEFFDIRSSRYGGRGGKYVSTEMDFAGVYILNNHTKDMFYVGQAKRVFQRVNNHFTGHGNGDVYADYKYGDYFTIKMINFENSGFESLNELERDAIMTYDAYSNGYNKTSGNRG